MMTLSQSVSPYIPGGPAVGPETQFYGLGHGAGSGGSGYAHLHGLGSEVYPRRYMYDHSCLYGDAGTMQPLHAGLVALGLFLGFAVGAATFARGR
jgi:hypothetical protein